ncbi:MAG: outer-membrane lipoprotein carrier protein LolA [Hyphomonadaceae bacterium]
MSILVATVLPLLLSGLEPALAITSTAAPAASRPAPVTTTPVPAVVQTPPNAAGAHVIPVNAPQAPAPQIPAPQTSAPQASAPQTPPAAGAPPSPATLSRDAALDKAAAALSGVKTAKGQFTQIDSMGGVATGDFYISRPGRVRFDYDSPEPMHIVSDGVSISIEEPKRSTYDAVPLASTPLNLFLRSNVDLKKDGSVVDVTENGGVVFLTLEDRTGEAQGQMTLEFRASDFELMGWRAVDGQGQETRVRLSNVEKNARVSNALFVVTDPADRDRNRR